MSQGICLLDEALDLARQEKTALEGGAFDRAMELAERRNEVTSMVWYTLEDGKTEQYHGRLLELTRMQDCLTKLASTAREEIKTHLQRSRIEHRRISGYRKSVAQALQ